MYVNILKINNTIKEYNTKYIYVYDMNCFLIIIIQLSIYFIVHV